MNEANLPRLELWYKARAAKVGIVVQTNDPHRLRALLYTDRRDAGDPTLDTLSLIASINFPSELWIVHQDALGNPAAEQLRKDLDDV